MSPPTGSSPEAPETTRAANPTRATQFANDPERTIAAPPGQGASRTTQSLAAMPGNRLPEGCVIGDYQIVGLVGEGGFGIVYRARDRALGRIVAIKEYMPSALAARTRNYDVSVKSDEARGTFEIGLRSFVNEARLLAQFDHPALVKVLRFWEEHDTAYMAMPLYEGPTLKQALKTRSPPQEDWLRQLLLPLLDALQLLHRNDCLHRDVSPDNILLTAGDRPLLLDFGAARRVIGDATQALTVILKPGFAPIEQYEEIAGLKQGPWTDLYALAAVVHYAIVGKAPLPAVGRMMHDVQVPLRNSARGRYGDAFLALIDQALAPLPQNRLRSTAEFRRALIASAAQPGADPGKRGGPGPAEAVTNQPERRSTAPQAAAPALGHDCATSSSPATDGLRRRRPTARWRIPAAAVAVTAVLVVTIVFERFDHGAVRTNAPVAAPVPAAPQPTPQSAQPPSLPDPPAPASATISPVVTPPASSGEPAALAAPAAPAPTAPPTRRQSGAETGKAVAIVRPRPAPMPQQVAPAAAQPAAVAASAPTLPTLPILPSASSASTASAAPATPPTPADELAAAARCLAQQDYGCTIKAASSVLQFDPSNEQALRLLNDAQWKAH